MSPMTNRVGIYAIALYVAVQMLADIGAMKAVQIGGFVTDGGFIYYVTFTLRDIIHKSCGIKTARTVIYASALINVVMVVYLWLVQALPATGGYIASGGQVAWQTLFGLDGMLVRIIAASIIAELVAELMDTEVYQFWLIRMSHLPQWTRVIASNAVSVPVDSLLFTALAFVGVLTSGEIVSMVFSSIALKCVASIATAWSIYVVNERR